MFYWNTDTDDGSLNRTGEIILRNLGGQKVGRHMHCLWSKYTCNKIIFTAKVLIIMPNQTAWANVVLTYGGGNYIFMQTIDWIISHFPPLPPSPQRPASNIKGNRWIVKSFANFPPCEITETVNSINLIAVVLLTMEYYPLSSQTITYCRSSPVVK